MNNDCLLWFFKYGALKCLAKFEMCVVVKIVCEQNLKTADIYCELRSIYRQNSSRKCSMSVVGVLVCSNISE